MTESLGDPGVWPSPGIEGSTGAEGAADGGGGGAGHSMMPPKLETASKRVSTSAEVRCLSFSIVFS